MTDPSSRKFKVSSAWTWTYEKTDFSYGHEGIIDASDVTSAKWISEARFPLSLIWPVVERKLSQTVTEL
jgi:hypothetical protein